jgi:2',3'-cyclic-nucleotide 2'-phosphodiesterase (5'-nucleotidase family)
MQFVEVFNALNVQVSCVGNHDVFDYGVDNFLKFIRLSKELAIETKRKTNTWLMANFFVKKDQGERKPIADLAGTHIIE